jgi:hypothetical protein
MDIERSEFVVRSFGAIGLRLERFLRDRREYWRGGQASHRARKKSGRDRPAVRFRSQARVRARSPPASA